MPIPGAAVSISLASSSEKISTWTDVDGSYSAAISSYGSYTVRVQMIAFANSTQQVTIDASHQDVQANFELSLLSRTQETTQPRRPGGTNGATARIPESLSVSKQSGQDGGGISDVVPSGMPVPGIDPNSATESIAVSGNTSNPFNAMSGDELQQRINDARQQGGGFGGGAGGFGEWRAGLAVAVPDVPGRSSDAAVLTSIIRTDRSTMGLAIRRSMPRPMRSPASPRPNPSYVQNSFGGSVGGPLNIPKIYHGGSQDIFLRQLQRQAWRESLRPVFHRAHACWNGRAIFHRRPTLPVRMAGLPVQIFNPATDTPFP